LTLVWKDSTYTLARVQDSANTSASPRLSATAAVAAAQAWLGLLDEGRFDQAWEQAAPALRSATAKDPWIEALQSTRAPLGKFKSRRPLSTTHTVSVRESPDGQQVSIQFETHFENQPQAIEAVTLLRNPDGVWQVAEYRVP